MKPTSDRVIVVGGGVIGAACAFYLSRAGRSVTLIEQGEFGRGCSHGNCGFICPSHVLPAAGPGAVWNTLKTLFARNSPLKVRWRFDPAMWKWFWQFTRKCNQQDLLRSGHAIQALLNSSREMYDQLLNESLTDVEWHHPGLLLVFRSAQALDHYSSVSNLLRDEFDVVTTRHEGPALIELEPSLLPGCAGAWHYPADGHLRPDKLMLAWRKALAHENVEIIDRCELRDLVAEQRLARRLVTTRGDLAMDQVVIATGAWTPLLQRMLRKPIAIQPGKGYSMTMPRPSICPRHAMIFEEHRVAITPHASSYRIGSTMEFAGYDAHLNPARLNLLREGAQLYLREPLAEPVLESWTGWRPMTPDGVPFIGSLPAFDNVYVSAGHGMLGVSMSPATGRLIAEIICGEKPHIDPVPYSLARKL